MEEAYTDLAEHHLLSFSPTMTEHDLYPHPGRARWFSTLDDYHRSKSGYRDAILRQHANIKTMEAKYMEFLQVDSEWRKNPENYHVAYRWLDVHPAFWLCGTTGESKHFPNRHAIPTILHEPLIRRADFRTLEKEDLVEMTLHPHSFPSCECYSYDPLFHLRASSFEQLLIKAAKQVDRYFSPDGAPRENVERMLEDYQRDEEEYLNTMFSQVESIYQEKWGDK